MEHSHVVFKTGFLSIALPANLTLVEPLLGVHPEVFVQSPRRFKSFTTHLATEETLSAVDFDMSFQVCRLYEVFATCAAPKRPLVEMDPPVRPHVARLSETFWANFTLVGLLTSMCSDVCFQLGGARKPLLADTSGGQTE